MIKVGDKFIGIEGREEVVAFIWLYDKTVSVESGLAYSYEEVYKSMYEQQKQRADELEKRWSALRDYLEERIETSKTNYENNKYIYSRYKTYKNVLFKIQQLQEDNNA